VPSMATVTASVRNGLLGQMVRYGVSGVGLTLCYSTIYLLALERVGISPLLSNCAAFLVTVILGYFIHSRWSFKGHGSREDVVRSGWRFLAVNLMGFALNSFWVWLIAEHLNLSARLPLIPIVVVTPWLSFWLNRRWTFGQ
jgi:putative flippase GtrA